MNHLRYAWAPFLRYGQIKQFKKGSAIFRQGEKSHGFYYLHQGEVKTKFLSEQGHERLINYIPKGTLLGEQGFKGKQHLVTAIAVTDSTLYYFSEAAFNQICHSYPDAIHRFMDSLIYKVRSLAEIVSLLDCPAEQQLAHYLYKLYQIRRQDHTNRAGDHCS